MARVVAAADVGLVPEQPGPLRDLGPPQSAVLASRPEPPPSGEKTCPKAIKYNKPS